MALGFALGFSWLVARQGWLYQQLENPVLPSASHQQRDKEIQTEEVVVLTPEEAKEAGIQLATGSRSLGVQTDKVAVLSQEEAQEAFSDIAARSSNDVVSSASEGRQRRTDAEAENEPENIVGSPNNSENKESDDDDDLDRRRPCYPFPADDTLDLGDGKSVNIAIHSTKHTEVEAVVFFMPGVHGGVGPGREPPNNFDMNAIFPTLARDLSSTCPVECIRLSWCAMSPPLSEGVKALCLAVHWTLKTLYGRPCLGRRRVLVVGHSMGGGVAMRAARLLHEQLLGPEKGAPPCLEEAELAGVAVLAAQASGAEESVGELKGIPKAFFHGTRDMVLDCDLARRLYELAAPPAKLKILHCGHDFYERRCTMIEDLTAFIKEHGLGEAPEEKTSSAGAEGVSPVEQPEGREAPKEEACKATLDESETSPASSPASTQKEGRLDESVEGASSPASTPKENKRQRRKKKAAHDIDAEVKAPLEEPPEADVCTEDDKGCRESEDEFKLVVSKRQRRQQNASQASVRGRVR